jgi:hypothetical protein
MPQHRSSRRNRRDNVSRPEYRETTTLKTEANPIANGDYDAIDTEHGGLEKSEILIRGECLP